MTVCKFDPRCRNQACTFEHPSWNYEHPSRRGSRTSEGPQTTTSPPVLDCASESVCWGSLCLHSDCKDWHHRQTRKQLCREGLRCSKGKSCSFVHPKDWYGPCEFGQQCMWLECPYKHEVRRQICKLSVGCTIGQCPMLHPDRGVSLSAASPDRGRSALLLHNLRLTRFAHLAKFADHCDKALNARAVQEKLDPEQAANADQLAAKADQLQMQLASFDAVCGPLVERVLTLQREMPPIDAMNQSMDGRVANDDLNPEGDSSPAVIAEGSASTASKESKALTFRLRREMYRLQAALPALVKREEINKLLAAGHTNFVVRGATGSGKSTQLPQYLAEYFCNSNGKGGSGKIICTQPRKVAATALAQRVAEEWGAGNQGSTQSKVGDAVGVRVGGYSKWSPWTQVEYMTEEVLLQELIRHGGDALRHTKAVILDEAHERTMKFDVLLGCLYDLQQSACPDLRLLVTSATLDVQLFSKYLGNCPIIEIPGRMYSVEDIYDPVPETAKPNLISLMANKALEIHKAQPPVAGDMLCFLPGQGDVEAAKSLLVSILSKTNATDAIVMVLHGGQDPEEQIPVFQKSEGQRRKIIFATDVAETSITIDGVRLVVDSGVKKAVVFDAKRNLTSLEVVPISRSSAMQRRGRAGRTASGTCYRLYSADDFEAMSESQTAEVLSQPAHLTVLTLLNMKLDPNRFNWLDAPDTHSVDSAWQTLLHLNAVEILEGGRATLTSLGRLAAHLQINPSWAKILQVGLERGLERHAAELVGVISVASSFFKKAVDEESRQQQARALSADIHPAGDIPTLFLLYQSWATIKLKALPTDPEARREQVKENNTRAATFCKEKFIRVKSVELARASAADFLKHMRKVCGNNASDVSSQEMETRPRKGCSDDELMSLIFAGCFLNLGVNVGGRGRECSHAAYRLVKLNGDIDDAVTVATVFPGSFLARRGVEAPQYICYAQVMQTSKLLLHGCVRLPSRSLQDLIERVAAVSPSFAALLQNSLPTMTSEKCEVLGFTTFLLTGSRAAQTKREIEEEFKCSLFYDIENGCVIAWSRPSQLEAVTARLEAARVEHKEMLIREVEEELLGGHTRAVYGRGGEVVCILYPSECITVNVNRLSLRSTGDKFTEMMAKYGELRSSSTTAAAGCNTQPSFFCQATFMEKDSAMQALLLFRNDCKDLVHVNAGGIRSPTLSSDISGFLSISWDVSDCVEGDMNLDSLAVSVAKLRLLIPWPSLVPAFEVETFFSERGRKGASQDKSVKTAGLRVVYSGGLSALQAAYSKWSRPDQAWVRDKYVSQKMVDSLDCSICLCSVARIHSAVFEKFQVKCPNRSVCRWSDCDYYHEVRSVQPCKFAARCTRGNACKFAHPRSWYSNGEPVETQDIAVLNPLVLATEKARKLGVKLSIAKKGTITSITLRHTQLNLLVEARDAFLEAFSCDVLQHNEKDLLFQKPGIQRLLAVQKDFASLSVHVQWDRTTRIVRIFGPKNQRSYALAALAKEATALKGLQKMKVLLQSNAGKQLRADWSILQKLVKTAGAVDAELKGCLLEVWANETQIITNFEVTMRDMGWLKEARPGVTGLGAAQQLCCSLCMCDFDEDVWQLQACGHKFCLVCVKGALSNPAGDSFPIRCPQPLPEGRCCQQPLVWRDLVGICNADVLNRIKRIAVDAFVQGNENKALYCPRPGCNHVVRPPQLLSKCDPSPDNEGKNKGLPVFCEMCCVTYCLACSQKLNKAFQYHDGKTCSKAQAAENTEVATHRSYIIETFLTLRCPRCKTAFFEYDGCAAVKCSSCPCGFCAKCFKDCGHDAHQHTNQCRGPGIPNIGAVHAGYSLSTPEFHRLNLQVAEYKIQMYLDSLPQEVRMQVVEVCAEDFHGRPGGSIQIRPIVRPMADIISL